MEKEDVAQVYEWVKSIYEDRFVEEDESPVETYESNFSLSGLADYDCVNRKAAYAATTAGISAVMLKRLLEKEDYDQQIEGRVEKLENMARELLEDSEFSGKIYRFKDLTLLGSVYIHIGERLGADPEKYLDNNPVLMDKGNLEASIIEYLEGISDRDPD